MEGFKGNPFPKIEVYRTELKRERLTGPNDNLIALAVDSAENMTADVPCFDRNDALGIAELIIEQFLNK